MAQLLIRNLDPAVVARLRARARARGRSLEAEARTVLEQSARVEPEAFWPAADHLRCRLGEAGRAFANSADDLREERER